MAEFNTHIALGSLIVAKIIVNFIGVARILRKACGGENVSRTVTACMCICSDTLTYKLVVPAVAVVEAERTLASRLVEELARHPLVCMKVYFYQTISV